LGLAILVLTGFLLCVPAETGEAVLMPRVVRPQFPTDDVVIATAIATEAPFNAKGDGEGDCSAAIQAAIDAVKAQGGGVVFLPAGRYRCQGNLTIKEAVTLRGDWHSPDQNPKVEGTVLMPVGGRGKEGLPAFISVEPGAGIRELSIWYPEQKPEEIAPYPWTIYQKPGDNCTVHRVTLVNSYQGIRIGPEWNELHTIRQVYGTPLKCGIWMDFCTDIGRLVQIRFAPKYWLESGLVERTPEREAALRRFLKEKGTGVEMRRSDWEYFFDLKLEGYARGVHVLAGEKGTANAVLYDVEATGGGVGLEIAQVNEFGLAVTNCCFVGETAGVLATGSFSTVSQFNACHFGGEARQAVRLDGNGKLSFQNCTFAKRTEAAVVAERGSLTLLGCEFLQAGPHVRLGPAVQRAHLLGNRFQGEPAIENQSAGDVQMTHCDFRFARPRKEAGAAIVPALFPDRRPATEKLFNVAEFGAKTGDDGDNTAAFQAALDAAGKAQGGTVYVPGGKYRFAGCLSVPAGVELRGIFDVPHHTISGGSVLMTTAGRGEENGTPFVTLAAAAGVRGLTIWYPEQDIRKITPYPWAIRGGGPGCWVMDVSTSNAYQGVNFGTNPSDNHLLRYVCGAPLKRGLYVSKGSGVVDECHFNPHFWGRRPGHFPEPKGLAKGEDLVRMTWEYQQRNLDAFIFGRCTPTLQVNNFVYAALHGLHFVDDGGGSFGRVINHGTDGASHGLTVEATHPNGLEFLNTELVLLGPTPLASFLTTEKFAGKVSLFNTLSWGAAGPTAVLRGKGEVLLQQWNTTQGLMVVEGGRAELENLHFQGNPAFHVQAGAGVEQLRLVGNTGPSAFRFTPGKNVTGLVNALPLGGGGGGTFRSGFETGQPQPKWKDHTENTQNVNGRCCHIEAGAGRDGGQGLVIAGEDRAAKPSYVYYKVFEANLEVGAGTVLSYWLKPENELSRHTGVDLDFADGSTLRDSAARDQNGQPLHPGAAKGKAGEWTKIECHLGRWHAGKTIRTIVVAYDDAEGTGSFKAAFDDLEIASPADEKVLVVRAEPAAGTHAAPLTVKLAAEPAAPVRYTVDGSLPDAQSPLYEKPVVLEKPGLYEVRFVATDAEGRPRTKVKSVLYEVGK
jgi:hypothetical protein